MRDMKAAAAPVAGSGKEALKHTDSDTDTQEGKKKEQKRGDCQLLGSRPWMPKPPALSIG
jgi:hypothetical protein